MTDTQQIEKACLNYLEGFYEGDTTKLVAALRPSLNKFGFWKKQGEANHSSEQIKMSYAEALNYALGVLEKKRFPKPDAPKKVEVLDVSKFTAAAKVTAWWGTDYLLLSNRDGSWMIEQVIWEGPLEK